MNIQDVNYTKNRNGDQVIMTMKAKDLRTKGGFQDFATLNQWYQEDPLKAHMGMQSFFGMQSPQRYPIYEDLINNLSVLEVNGWEGKFTYDVPVEQNTALMTVADNSDQEYAGRGETVFKITLNEELAPGTTITANAYDGITLSVSDAAPVRAKGDGFEHLVQIVSNNTEIWYPSYLLSKGIEYFVTGHGVAERGTEFAKVRMPNTTAYETCEFRLGSVTGVEAYATGKADSVNIQNAAVATTRDYYDKLMEEADRLGDVMMMFNLDKSGRPIKKTGRIAATMEYLVFRELDRLTAHSLLFQRAGTVRSTNGNIRYNEGLWHQLRRGKIISYGKRGGITREHIKEAADYVFRANPYKPTIERKIVFKCGTGAHRNVLDIFSDEVNEQLANLAPLLGSDRVLPKSPVSGDLYNLSMAPVRFVEVYLKDIGMVKIIEDPSLNYVHLTDKKLAGFGENSWDHTAFSMIIWDAESAQYSNNRELPKGTEIIKGGNPTSNFYLVKPQGEFIYSGTERGRYDYERATNIVSSSKFIQQSFWAYNNCSIWVRDVSKFVMIELDPSERKGYL